MTIYDLSQKFFASRVYPGDPIPVYQEVMRIDNGNICNLSSVSACVHNSTHLDAPFHFINNGDGIDKIPLEKCIGYCNVIECYGEITGRIACDITQKIRYRKILLKGENEITEEAARVFSKHGIEFIGVEDITVGNQITGPLIHKILLGAGVVIAEGLVMTDVREGKYFLVAAPIKYEGLDGAPCRPILIGE